MTLARVQTGVHLTRALADARKHGEATVSLGHVVDEFHDQHCLADASAAKETDFAATLVGRQQIHDLSDRSAVEPDLETSVSKILMVLQRQAVQRFCWCCIQWRHKIVVQAAHMTEARGCTLMPVTKIS